MTTISSAAHQYARRPKDERFPSVDALVTAATAEKNVSVERTYNLRDLSVSPTPSGDLALRSPKGEATFTHWSFGQFARTVGAPASFLREDLSPKLAADVLNYRIEQAPVGQTLNLLAKSNGHGPVIRASSSESYGRLWDADLYAAVLNQITRHDARWTLPPTWSGESAGAYRGDRDSFLILTNGGSIVTDPSVRDSGEMYRGLLLRNSEVGASSVVIESILYRFVCGNHMLWGAIIDRAFRRRHVGTSVLRDTVREIGRIAHAWTEHSEARDTAIIRGLIDHELALTRAGVVDELRAMGATREQAESAYDRCEQTEAVSPRSFWGMAQGLTRVSQDAPYQDERYELDRLAAVVLARGRKLVAA